MLLIKVPDERLRVAIARLPLLLSRPPFTVIVLLLMLPLLINVPLGRLMLLPKARVPVLALVKAEELWLRLMVPVTLP